MVDFAQYLDDSESAAAQGALNRAGELARRYHELEEETSDLERRLKDKRAELRTVAEEDLPAALDEAGLSEVKLPSGEGITVKEEVRPPSMGERGQYRPKVIAWLEEHGLDDVVKDTVTVRFGRGEDDRVREVLRWLTERGITPERVRTVNPATLRSLFKEIHADEQADPIPYDELGVQVVRLAKLSKPR